ncbi:MAG TPA: DUF5686 family protein [Chryseosolibacter sp.]|nr:DUF5686 family protein [Chryseosolibacter sp.]
MNRRLSSILVFLFFSVAFTSVAQKSGVRGSVVADDGTALSFATIFVKQLGSGTTANVDGKFEIPLESGRYDLVFQHLGRRTVVRVVQVQDNFVELNITLEPQDIMLKEITIGSDDEDPAYTIMRKAIAKAAYHRNVVDRYTAKVYIKGSAKLKDYPWLAKKALEKDGIEKGRVYLSESLSEIRFTRPNKFEQKVISVRSDRKENANPGSYIFGSFYEPEIAETVTPLSPKAFSYYKFQYLGTFKDRDFEVSRIKVIPRSKGENVVEGTIYIVEDWWSIHTLDISTSKLGIAFQMKVTFAPIDDKVWLPVSHQFKVDDKVFGFEFEAHYLTSVRDYKVTLNPAIYVESMQVVDETAEKALAKEVEKKQAAVKKNTPKKKQNTANLQERLASGEEITRKELKSIIKEYEKEERKDVKGPEVLSDFTFDDDSTKYHNDSTYWTSVRPIPLTTDEIEGYQKADSIAAIERAKEEGDTLKASSHKGFQPWDVIVGDSYRITKRTSFRIYPLRGGFNTVEGLNGIYRVAIGTVLPDTNRTRIRITPVLRYAFSREKFSGYLNFMTGNQHFRLDAEAGRYVAQFNQENPILPLVNTFTTLFLEQNLMKLYEHEFAALKFRKVVDHRLTLFTNLTWSDRTQLVNTTDFKIVDRNSIEAFTPNQPKNLFLTETSFGNHQALVGAIRVVARPWVKFRSHNGRKYPVARSSPALTMEYRKGFDDVLGSDVDYDLLEAGVRHGFDVGARGTVDVNITAGKFLNDRQLYFMDFKHFLGNRTPFITNDPIGSFRLLDYYRYSTADRYIVGNIHYQFRKFLITTLPTVRLAGIRENLFANYVKTPTSPHYAEFGYSIDGILRVFRLEGAVSFEDGKETDLGFRLGIATTVTIDFGD